MWPGQSAEEVGLRVISGGKPHRWPVPRAQRCTVQAVDIDRDAGLAAALIVSIPFRGAATAYEQTYEHDAVRGWTAIGGTGSSPAERALARARPSAARSGPAVLISVGGVSRTRSYVERLRLSEEAGGRGSGWLATVSWVCTVVVEASVEVDHILVSGRRIDVPDHGRCVVVWKSPASASADRPTRPRIAAVDRSGRILTELAPDAVLDTATIAFLDESA